MRDRFAFWSALAAEEERPSQCSVEDEPLPVAVAVGDLGAVVDALVGNVFSHTPDGIGFSLAAGRTGEADVWMQVDDDGPGLGDRRSADRGVSGGSSTGLGLDIVRRTVEAAGGELDLAGAPDGGTTVTLRLPASPTPAV